jgi:Predicted nucleotidyltransferases
MTEYRQTLLDEEAHQLIGRGKMVLRKKLDRSFSVAEVIKYYMRGALRLDEFPEPVREYVNEFVVRISADEKVLGMVLFGSYSRGDQTKYSDIDVFIVYDGEKTEAYKSIFSHDSELKKLRNNVFSSSYFSDIEPFIVPYSDLEVFKPIYLSILREGILLFERKSVISKFFKWIMGIKSRRIIIDSSEVLNWTL